MQSQNPVTNVPAQPVLPESPIVSQIEQAVVATEANHTPEQIVADIEAALNLFVEFKSALGGLHPSAINIVKTALSLLL